MMEENKRSIFALNGITGMLIATVLLITILIVLTIWGLGVQQSEASNFYEIKNAKAIEWVKPLCPNCDLYLMPSLKVTTSMSGSIDAIMA